MSYFLFIIQGFFLLFSPLKSSPLSFFFLLCSLLILFLSFYYDLFSIKELPLQLTWWSNGLDGLIHLYHLPFHLKYKSHLHSKIYSDQHPKGYRISRGNTDFHYAFLSKDYFFPLERVLSAISNLVRNQDTKIIFFFIYSERTLSRNSLSRLYRAIRVFRWAISAKKKFLMRHITHSVSHIARWSLKYKFLSS